MSHETSHQMNHQFRRLPKGERRVRFADSMGMELVSIFLFDLMSKYCFASIHKQLSPPLSAAPATPLAPVSPISSSTPATLSQPRAPVLAPVTPVTPSAPAAPKVATAPSPKPLPPTLHHQHHQQQQKQHTQQQQQQLPPTAHYVCEFTQPISLVSFKERVKLNKIHLETCHINSRAGNISVSCTIRVLNQSYDKSVIVRYTTDEWHTYTDTLASYLPGSNDGWSDRFTSTFSVTNQVKQFQTGQRIIYATRIIYDGDKVHWDNNGGLNYVVKKL